MENLFTPKMPVKTDAELQKIVKNKNEFQELAVLAAILELEKREKGGDELIDIREKIEIKLEKSGGKAKPFEIPKDIPNSIKKASYILFGTILIGLLNWFLFDHYIEVGINSRSVSILFLTLGFMAFLSYMILTGRAWARTLFLVIFIIGFLVSIQSQIFLLINVPFISLGSFVQNGLEVYALILLFNKESKDWYLQQKAKVSQ